MLLGTLPEKFSLDKGRKMCYDKSRRTGKSGIDRLKA